MLKQVATGWIEGVQYLAEVMRIFVFFAQSVRN
jgi:hypothetical protein